MAKTFMRFRSAQLVDVLALFLGVVGSVSSAAIFFSHFYPTPVIFVSLAITLSVLIVTGKTRSNFSKQRRPISETLLLVVSGAIALLFRWGPYRFEQGGQDQGLYVNMATTLSRWGSVRFPDVFRQSLDSSAQAIYDQTRLASYYLIDSSKSLMTIEFYPLHPALMALAQSVFGGLGSISLTVISLLGVLGAWHLALEIDGRRQVANLFVLLFSVNPALVFFAKFPVSESVALTFVIFGMLYFIRFVRSSQKREQSFYFLISILSFNSLFYVRWQFLLYIPFFSSVAICSMALPKYREYRNRIVLFVAAVFILFAISMVYYMKKQPELYTPVRNSLVDMLPSTSGRYLLVGAIIACASGITSYYLLKIRRLTLPVAARRIFTIEQLGPYSLILVLVLTIPSVLSLYAGESMYPWGYRVPAEVDSWVIRYHAGYRLALFACPVLFATGIIGNLKRPARNRATGILYFFAAICFAGILLRPFVPYLYYYGRYLIVDLLPAFMLLAVITLVSWMKSRHRAIRIASISFAVSAVAYSLIFTGVLFGRHEGEDSGFYSAIAKEVTKNDVVIVSSTSQQVIVPLRATYEINILSIPDVASGFTTQDVIETFEPIAKNRGGRLLYLVPRESAPSDFKFVDEFTFTDRYFTNTDHFRGDGLRYLSSRRRLLLPTRWQSGSVTWQLFELNLR